MGEGNKVFHGGDAQGLSRNLDGAGIGMAGLEGIVFQGAFVDGAVSRVNPYLNGQGGRRKQEGVFPVLAFLHTERRGGGLADDFSCFRVDICHGNGRNELYLAELLIQTGGYGKSDLGEQMPER